MAALPHPTRRPAQFKRFTAQPRKATATHRTAVLERFVRLSEAQAGRGAEAPRGQPRSLCRFSENQAAVNAADNQDTIVILPGFYTEPTARKAPHDDPRCKDMMATGTRSAPAPTYDYHFNCPNDINLIVDAGAEPVDPGPSGQVFAVGRKGGKTGAPGKEVGLRLERTDEACVANMTVNHAHEHGFYSIEADEWATTSGTRAPSGRAPGCPSRRRAP